MRKIMVLFGGLSPEYGVSLESAAAVISHMDKERYEPVPVGITHTGDWFYYAGDPERIRDDTWCSKEGCIPATISLSRSRPGLLLLKKEGADCVEVDAALPILHGKNGEDGTVQGLLELAGIPVAGCGVLSSALCMDKDRAHKLAKEAGMRVPASHVYGKNADVALMVRQAAEIGYPLFVKPVKAGSSYGITKVEEESRLLAAAECAFAYDDKIILEECISGFEVGCALLGTEDPVVGEVDEIELSEGFFDFTEKYTLKTSAIHVPARIPEETARKIKKTAKRIYKALDCRGFARVDMFLSREGEIVFNEVNTIPGFTAHSRFPNMMQAAGISFSRLITAILEEACGESTSCGTGR